jgi:hypothetical protein
MASVREPSFGYSMHVQMADSVSKWALKPVT